MAMGTLITMRGFQGTSDGLLWPESPILTFQGVKYEPLPSVAPSNAASTVHHLPGENHQGEPEIGNEEDATRLFGGRADDRSNHPRRPASYRSFLRNEHYANLSNRGRWARHCRRA